MFKNKGKSKNKRGVIKLFSVTAAMALFLGGALFAWTGCDEETAEVGAVSELDDRLVDANTGFGLELLRNIHEEEGEENLFISPASISLALSMTYQGADGDTKEEMAEVLGYEGIELEELNQANADLLTVLGRPDEGVEMSLANSIWKREEVDFYEDFMEVNEEYYDAEVQALDFGDPEASDIINQWVEEETRGHIEDIVDDDIDPLTIMFLINALYFQGDWALPFDEEKTSEQTFYLPEGEEIEVPMMQQQEDLAYLEKDDFQAVRLPYGEEERVSMYVFLPSEEVGLEGFYNKLKGEVWENWLEDFETIEGNLQLPRFDMEYEVELKNYLEGMGMDTAFHSNKADFGNMRDITQQNTYLSSAKHKTFVEVDEKGTEAAAATSVEVGVESALPESFNMTVNRPFFFAIQDDATGALLFAGSVVEP